MMPKLKDAKPAPPREDRDERLAVNAVDLGRLDAVTLVKLTSGRVDFAARVDLRDGDPRSEEVAVECTGPLLDSAVMCDMLRDLDRRADEKPTRVYVRRRGWTRLAGTVLLTVPDGRGGFRLNPDVFPPVVTGQQLSALAPPTARVRLGRN